LRYNSGYTSGSLTVKGQTTCGTIGNAYTYSVIAPFAVPTPVNITSRTVNYNACRGDTVTYAITPGTPTSTLVAANVYRWTKPNNTTVYSANSDSSRITLQFNNGYTGGSLAAYGRNACGGVGTTISKTLTHLKCVSELFGRPVVNSSERIIKSAVNVNVFPNPSNANFELIVYNFSDAQEKYLVRLLDMEGRLLKIFAVKPSEKYFFGNELKAGTYILEINGSNQKIVKRIIKF
jgi:hypothetical protein